MNSFGYLFNRYGPSFCIWNSLFGKPLNQIWCWRAHGAKYFWIQFILNILRNVKNCDFFIWFFVVFTNKIKYTKPPEIRTSENPNRQKTASNIFRNIVCLHIFIKNLNFILESFILVVYLFLFSFGIVILFCLGSLVLTGGGGDGGWMNSEQWTVNNHCLHANPSMATPSS